MTTVDFARGRIARLEALAPRAADLPQFAALCLDAAISVREKDSAMGVVSSSELSVSSMLASARIAAEMLPDPDKLAAKPEGIVDLGVIEWLMRPALPVTSTSLQKSTSGLWSDIDTSSTSRASGAICRLDIAASGMTPTHVGTGFIVGVDSFDRYVILTNAHVLEDALHWGWPQQDGIDFACDFERFSVHSGGPLRIMSREYRIHENYDLAVLYLPKDGFCSAHELPPTLTVSSVPPEPVEGHRIGVLGHPAFDSKLDPFPSYFGFGNEFGIKRFSPGTVREIVNREWRHIDVDVFLHDASTLSGSSGSCVLDLGTFKVLGLHFGGWPLPARRVKVRAKSLIARLFESNGAVPLWLLADDMLLSEVRFE